VSYVRFIATLVVSLMVMFILSFEQVRSLDHFYLNASNFYVSLTMVGAMGLIMLGAMWRMFKDRQQTLLMAGALAVVLVGGFSLARTETFVGDKGFLDSMIPRHSRALLVCEEVEPDRSGDHLVVSADHRESNQGDQPDEADPRALLVTGPATRLLATMIRSIGPGLVLAVGLVACSATGSDDRCLSAFRSVDPRALPPYGASPLDDAVRNCGSVRQWQAAWDSVPSAHEGTTDAVGFLISRCALASLAPTSICREVTAGT